MPGTGFRKAALASAIASIYSVMPSLSYAVPVVISGAGLSNVEGSEITGELGSSGALQLDISGQSGFFVYASCDKSTNIQAGNPCNYTNNGNVKVGSASSGVFIKENAKYKLTNAGSISAPSGTAILTDTNAGDLSITNSGDIIGATAINYTVDGGLLTVRLPEGGTIAGDIAIADDNDLDILIFQGGALTGNVSGIEKINVVKGESDIDGVITFNASNSSNNKLAVSNNATLSTNNLVISSGVALDFKSGSSLKLGVKSENEAAGSNTPVVRVDSGTLAIAGAIEVVPSKSMDLTSQKTVFLVDTDNKLTTSSTVTSSPLFILSNQTNTNGDLGVTIVEDPDSPEVIARRNGASGTGSSAYGEGYNASKGNTGADADKLYRAIVSKVGDKASAFAEELAPTTNGGAIALSQDAQDLSHQNISRRLNAVSAASGISSGSSALATKTVWLQGLYSDGDQKDRKRSDGTKLLGYTSRLEGFTFGLDTEIGADWLAGAALSFGRGSVNKNTVKDNTDIDTYLATLYGRWNLDSRTTLDLFFNYGVHKNKRERYFDIEDAILEKATGDYDSRQYGLKALLSQTILFNDWAVTPMLGVHYGRFDIDGYTEKGSAGALKLDDQDYEIIEAGAGIGVSRSFDSKYGQFIPEAKVMGWHDFSADAVEVKTRFVVGGDSFVAKGLEPEKTTWTASVGVTYVENEKFEMATGYERSWREGYHSDNVYLRAEYRF